MKLSFARAVTFQRDVCSTEAVRVAYVEASAARLVAQGRLEPGPSIGFAGLRRRLEALREVAEVLAVLAEHEEAVRSIDPRLALELPSMWPEGSAR